MDKMTQIAMVEYFDAAETFQDGVTPDQKVILSFSVRIANPAAGKNEYLVTIKARDNLTGEAQVAFFGDTKLAEAILGALKRALEGALTWRKDSYAR